MPKLENHLEISRCPHCNVDNPSLTSVGNAVTKAHSGANQRHWRIYACARCGGIVTAAAKTPGAVIIDIFPTPENIDEAIPHIPRTYLQQALESLHVPAGAIILAARAVDAMLKENNYREGSLYQRINSAADDHLITADMAKWAHEVRLDANEQRHADEASPFPDDDDAKRSVDFAMALGQLLFVLPSRVKRGLKEAVSKDKSALTT